MSQIPLFLLGVAGILVGAFTVLYSLVTYTIEPLPAGILLIVCNAMLLGFVTEVD